MHGPRQRRAVDEVHPCPITRASYFGWAGAERTGLSLLHGDGGSLNGGIGVLAPSGPKRRFPTRREVPSQPLHPREATERVPERRG